jgi:hypothetical protein
MWPILGKLSVCSLCANIFGAIGWGCFGPAIAYRYLGREEGTPPLQQYENLAQSYTWLIPWLLGYAVEVLCMSISKLIILDRLLSHVGRSSKIKESKIRRISLGLFLSIVLLNVAGLAANIAVSVYNAFTVQKFLGAAAASSPGGNVTQASGLFLFCTNLFTSNSTHMFVSGILYAEAYELYATSSFILLFQNWFEAITFVAIVIVFLVISPMSAVILRRAYSTLNHKAVGLESAAHDSPAPGSAPAQLALEIVERVADDALKMRLRILLTGIFVLFGLLPRVVFDVLQAYANTAVKKSSNPNCGICDSCQEVTW